MDIWDEEGIDPQGYWGEPEPQDATHAPMSPKDNQHRDALVGALYDMVRGTDDDAFESTNDSDGEDQLPVVVIRTKRDLEYLEQCDAMVAQCKRNCERRQANDFLTSMFYPIPGAMIYRYDQMQHIFKLICFTNAQVPRPDRVDDGARLSDRDIEVLAMLCLPQWWKEVGEQGPHWWKVIRQGGDVSLAEALPRAWDAYRTSGPEMCQLTVPFPCTFKKLCEDALILWSICFVPSVTQWYFGTDPNGKPNVADLGTQQLLMFRGKLPACSDSIAGLLDMAVCQGKSGTKGALAVITYIHQMYPQIIDAAPKDDPPENGVIITSAGPI